MSQELILNFLMEERNKNNNWLTIPEIKEMLKKKGFRESIINKTHNHLFQLCIFDLVECRGVGLWDHHKTFRLKK